MRHFGIVQSREFESENLRLSPDPAHYGSVNILYKPLNIAENNVCEITLCSKALCKY